MENNPNDRKVMGLCRLCHFETLPGSYKNLFHNENQNPQILEIIEILTGLKIYEEDPFPKIACSDCHENLLNFYYFRKLILQVDEKFHAEWYNTKPINDVATEIEDPLIGPEHKEGSNEDNESQQSNVKSSDLDSKTLIDDEKQTKLAKQGNCENTGGLHNSENENPPNSVTSRQYNCNLCSKSFLIKTYLTIHQRLHTCERPFRCSTCNEGFISSHFYERHLNEHHNEKTYLCDICGKKFKQKSWFDKHKHVKPQNDEKFICEVCNKIFTTHQKLIAHLLIDRNRKKEYHPCPICNKLMSSRSILTNHLKIHTGERPYSCDICNANFLGKTSLVAHKRIHNNEKPFSCHICSRSFRVKSALTVHIRSHTNQKPYSCNICFKSYCVKGRLNEHMMTHSNSKHICEIFSKTFSWRRGLSRHQKKHNKNKSANVENK